MCLAAPTNFAGFATVRFLLGFSEGAVLSRFRHNHEHLVPQKGAYDTNGTLDHNEWSSSNHWVLAHVRY